MESLIYVLVKFAAFNLAVQARLVSGLLRLLDLRSHPSVLIPKKMPVTRVLSDLHFPSATNPALCHTKLQLKSYRATNYTPHFLIN